MSTNSKKTNPKPSLGQIKKEVDALYDQITTTFNEKTREAKNTWDSAWQSLENKRTALENKAKELERAGSTATADIQAGFDTALNDIKKGFENVKRNLK